MTEIIDGGPIKRRGRPPGASNKITRDIRAALRDLAENNADRVQSWLDSVAEKDPADAMRLWLALLRFVTPTLQAAAITDLTPPKRTSELLARMADDELMEVIVNSPEAIELVKQGVKTKEGLLLGIIDSAKPKAPRRGLSDIDTPPSADDDLLR